jgi:hypothetical protein
LAAIKGEKTLAELAKLFMIMFLAGYLVWTDMVSEPPRAIAVVEQITGRQVGAEGRVIVGDAVRLVEAR